MRIPVVELDFTGINDGILNQSMNNIRSEIFTLSKNDYIKGFIVAVIGAVLTTILQALTNHTGIDWSVVANVALTAGISYLVKNFFTSSNGKVLGIVG